MVDKGDSCKNLFMLYFIAEPTSSVSSLKAMFEKNIPDKERKNPNFDNILATSREKFFTQLQKHKQFLKEFIEENQKSKVCLIPLFQQFEII